MRLSTGYHSALVLLALVVLGCEAQDQRQNPQASGVVARPRQQKQQTQQKQAPIGNITCGTLEDLVNRVEVCAAPLMDILQGSIAKWPRTDADIGDLCQSFFGCERCIRDNSRKCAKGLQKTIISTLANSIQRARKRECSPAKYPPILKTTRCIETHQKSVQDMVLNATNHLLVIENQMKDPDQKTTAVCCMVNDMEAAIKSTLNPVCPVEASLVTRLYRTVLEDVLDLICVQPKCNNVFKGYTIQKTNDIGGIIAILLRIVFSLG